jgi:DNA-binding response OmpR family regulator
LRILVIEEEAFLREALQRVLSGLYAVITAETVAAGLALLEAAPTDLVIIGVVLPAVDGIAAIRDIRRQQPQVRIIAIAGSGTTGLSSYRPDAISTNAYVVASAQAGAHATIVRPFETQELRQLIEHVLAGPRG